MFSAFSIWLILSLVLICLELLTTSFYLLMLSLACLSGALVAYLGGGEPAQITTTALVALVLLMSLRRFRHRFKLTSDTKNMNLDIGAQVEVKAFTSDGTAIVDYRGTQWQARLENNSTKATAQPGCFVIVGMDGNTLIISPSNPS